VNFVDIVLFLDLVVYSSDLPPVVKFVSSLPGSLTFATKAYYKPRLCLSKDKLMVKKYSFYSAELCMSHSFTLEFSTLNIILFRLLYTSKTKHGTTNFFFALSTLYK
jgi:hypothetical protein